MNGSCELAQAMSEALSAITTTNEILICPPVIFLAGFPKNDAFQLGGQNVSNEVQGAFTGEISADMLRSVGATYVIVGHSERRAL